jgi:radical SAM-linked protein
VFPVRLRYAKRGRVRFLGHRDVARALERAFRVTQLPLAFTEGFSPRPRVSFGLALSTGYESDAEYLDVQLARPVDLDALPGSLTGALPEGISVTGAAALAERAPALQEAVTSVEWSVAVARADGSPLDPPELGQPELEQPELEQLVAGALAAASLPVRRTRKGREELADVRPAIRSLTVDGTTLTMELHTRPVGARPSEVLAATGRLQEVRVLRTHQWIERDGARLEPLDADTRPRAPEARAS